MAKNKDDEFDFEWDDESSFDSKLDNFDGDVDEYHGDEIESAEKDRNPVASKLKSIIPTITDAGNAFIAGAGKGIGRAIEDDMPEVYQAYQQGTHVLSEARIARQEISNKFKPWWNDTKRAVRKLSQQLEGQMPFSLDKKILKLIGEEDRDQQYKQPSKESLRQEQMNSNINQIFELQMQKSMEQQKDAVLNRTYDRRVDAIRHKESAGFLAKIAESSVFHQAFTNSVFTAYLKKDLELKYKQFYATEDILGVMTNHAKAVDTKLDAVIKNTALPEADKIYMSERIIGRAKENIANKFNDKLNNYFSKMRENLVNKFKDAIDWAELIPEMLNMQSEILEMTNDEDMQGLGGSELSSDNPLTKKGLMKLGLGKIGNFFGRRILRKLTSKLPQETMESLKYYFGGGRNGLALLADDLAQGRLKGLPSGLRSILKSIAPDINNTTQTIVNESWQTLHEGGKITNKFIQAVEEVIPGYLKMQTRYLEILATGKDSGLLEWDPKRHAFRTQQELADEFAKSISIKEDETINGKNKIKRADARIRNGATDTTQLIQHVADSYGSKGEDIQKKLLKAQATSVKDIELFKVNLAHSEDYWRIDESILEELNTIATSNDENKIQETNLWKTGMFKGIKSPVNVAGFWLDILADRTRDGLVPNKVAIDHLNAIIVKERINYSGRHRAIFEKRVKDTGHYFLLDKFSTQDRDGNYIVDESAILRQQMNTTSSNNELMQKLTPEEYKFYNQTFLDIKEEEEASKKNWLVNLLKEFKEKLSKSNSTKFAKVKKFFADNYEKLSNEAKQVWNHFKIKTFDKELTLLGKIDGSFYNLRDKLIYEENGEKKLRNLSDLTEEEWYDWFVSIEDITDVLNVFNGKSALSQILRSILPDHIQSLLIAARDDKDLIKNMKATARMYPGNDAENVNKRMQINKEAARKAIEKANKAITSRMTSRIGSTIKSNMDDDDYKALRESNIKMHENEYNQLIKVDTEKLNENSQIDISKEQLKILRNIDNQLGLFYQAFIDDEFKQGESLVFNKSKGKIEGDQGNYALNAEISKWLNILNNPAMSGWHTFAKEQLKQNGFANENAAKEWLNDRNDTLKNVRSRLEDLRYSNTGAIDDATGAVLRSNAELDELTSDEALKEKYGENVNINDELRYQERYNAQRKMLRKHYIRLLKTSYIKDNSNNPIYTYFANIIISNENVFSMNANATIKGEYIYKAVVDFIQDADTDDSRRSLIKYLKLLLVRDKALTSSIRREDIRIGVIQEFLPRETSDILQYALNYVKEVEAHGSTSDNAIITNTQNVVNIGINNSSYEDLLRMRADQEKELDRLNKEIENIYGDEDDVYISEEDKLKGEKSLISRDATKSGLKTIDTAINNKRKHARGGSYNKVALAYSKQLLEDRKLDAELRKNYKYGKYLDEKYSSIDLMRIRSALSPQEQQTFDAEFADFNNNWFPRFINRLKHFRSSRWEKHTNGIPVIDANKIDQNIKFSPWDREYIENFLNVLTTTPAAADFASKLIWAKSDRQSKLPKGLLLHEASHVLDSDAQPIQAIDPMSAHIGKGVRFEKHADWNAVKRLLASGDIKGVRGYINWLQRMADNFDPNNISDLRWRANLLIKAAKRYGYDLNQGLKHKKFANGGSYTSTATTKLSRNRFNELAREYIGLTKLWDGKSTPDPAVIQQLQTGMNKFMTDPSDDYVNFRPYWTRRISLELTKSIYEFLQRHPEYRDQHLESLVNNVCLCVRTAKKSHAQSPLSDDDKLALQCIEQLFDIGPSARIGRDAAHSIILYPEYYKLRLPVLYHELGHIVDQDSSALTQRSLKEIARYNLSNSDVLAGHGAKGDRFEHHADWYGIRKTYELDKGPRKVYKYLRKLMKSIEKDKHQGDIYVKDSENAKPRIAIIGRGVNIGAYAYKIVRNDGTVDWIPLDDTHHISRAVYQIKDISTGNPLTNPIQVISIDDIRKTQKSMIEGGTVGLCAYSPDTNDYVLATDKTDVKYRTNLMYRALRRYGMDPNKGRKEGKKPIKEMYAKGDNISFSLPIDQYGGYVDQPTDILGGAGIAGEAGGETILPHKFNERFKELLYRCLKDTVSESMARRVLGMLNPSETTEDKLGILLSDNDRVKFASGGSTAPANDNIQTDTNTINSKDEYTKRRHPTNTIKDILLNIMESNEAIYSKLGDGLLVVDLSTALDKLKNSNLMNKLKSLKISERIGNFIFGTDNKHKGLIRNIVGLGTHVAKGIVNNIVSFDRHLLLGSKVCDVFLKSDIVGQVHGDKKISAAELENGTIFSDARCTKPIYSVADIYPPVYRKKIDENGNIVVEEAITEEEARPGLVDVNGDPLTYFGGKVGRFLHNIAMKPINAIFSKSALEKVKNIGSTISSGIRHGFDGFFGAYCDVYSARDPEKMLVSGTSIKEGRLVRISKERAEPKVVPTVFDIDGECWIMIDDPNDATKRILGDKVIYDEDIKAGLQHRDGTPIESSKLSLAMSKLRHLAGTVGNALAGLTGGAFGIAGKAISFVWEHGTKAAGWLKDKIVNAFTAKDPYIDVCIVKNGKLEVVITGEDLKTNKATLKYCFRDDKGEYSPVLSAYGIDSPVYTMVGKKGQTLKRPRCIITKEDLENGVFDIDGNRLTKWAGRSLAGKIGTVALGAVKFGWKTIKGIGKGIWKIGTAAIGKLGSLLGEGGAAVTSIITNAWNSTLDLFRNTVVSRKDLQEIVGDRLLDIYGLLYKYMPRKTYNPNDKDGDGDVDGSWADYEQRRKEREEKRKKDKAAADAAKAAENDTEANASAAADDDEFDASDGLLAGWLAKDIFGFIGKRFKKGWSKLKGLFGKKAATSAAAGTAEAAAGATGAGAAANQGWWSKAWNKFKGLFGKKAATPAGAAESAEEFHARVAAQRAAARQAILASSTSAATSAAGTTAAAGATSAAGRSVFTKLLGSLGPKVAARVAAIAGSNALPIVGQIASIGMTLWTVYEVGKWLITDSPKTKNMRSIRCKGYGVNSKYWEAVIDLETDTFEEFTDGNTDGVDKDRLRKFGYKVDFLDLSNPDSEKLEFLTTWYRQRFIPAYNFYLGCMRTVGVEFDDDPPKDDDIPGEKYAVFVTEFTKHIDKFSNGPTKILRLDNSAYTTWLANKHEKERDEGLTSSKYNDNNLADDSISKYVGSPSDNLGYAWNELKHGNLLNSLGFASKAIISTPVYAVAKGVDVIWRNISSWYKAVQHMDQRSDNEKAWDEVRFKLYGLDKDNISEEEYSRITNTIKEFEVDQVHVIDGEQQVLEDELKDLAKELFPAKVRQEVKNRLMLTNDFTDNVSDDLLIEARSFVFSWYKRIFVPIFTAYAKVVRSACGDEPGDNISIDSIPEENRLPLLKEFERQSNKFLATNIDAEILRLSSKGFYDFLVMRSEEDKAELAKDAQGLLTEEETTFSDKLSRNLNDAGKNFSDAWNALVKEKNVVKALGNTIKGIGNTVIGVFKSVGTSIGESIADFFHGSKNEHAWEERFFDYGFMDRESSSDGIFANDNIKAMNEFEEEAGRILLEDNTSKPDDKFFISLAFNCKYIENCCASLFGIAINSLEASGQAMLASIAIGKLTLPMVKTILIRHITSKLAEDKNKAQQVEDVSQKISDMLNYLDFWYTFRFKPVFGTFINVVSQYGVDAADIDVDDIPVENRKEALEQYRKMVGPVLKKNNIQRYNLSPEGLATYLNELYAYREDIKDGNVDNKHNPLAAYYKEKEETYKNEVINAVVANAFGLSKEDKAHVANSLAKASTEIDNELNDVSLMATIAAKDALKDLGVDSLIDVNYNKAEATIVGKLMELTTGYNNYDRLGVGSGFLWDDKLGEVFTDFMKDAHKYLYKGGSAEDLHKALTKFMNIYLESKVFRTDGLTQDVNTLDKIMLSKYPHVAASNATFKYFANWFSHRFIPYYTYYVTLVNKANKVDDKDEPELGKLTSTHRRYVLMKLLGADKKNLIPNKAKALKLTQQDMDNYYKRENAIAEQRTQTTKSKRQSRAVLQKQVDEIRKRYEENRDKAYAESNRTEPKDLSTIKAVDGVATGATVGGRYAKHKGTSLSDKDRQYVWDFLISQLGLTEPQAAAVMGNMMQESGLSCDVVNGIGATGICQWLGNRLYGGNGYVGLIPFAKANGLDYMSVEAQMKYLQWELTHNKYERDRFDAFVRSVPTDQNDIDKTIAQCAVGFRVGYERCGKHEANDAKRVSYAKAMYNTFNTSGDSTDARNMNSAYGLPSHIARYNGSSETSNTQPTGTVNGTTGTATGLPQHIVRYEPLKDDEQQLTDIANSVVTEDTTAMGDKLREVADVKSGVNIKNMHPVLKDRFAAMSKAFTEIVGHRPLITSGARTMAQQAALKKKYGKGAASPNPYAPHISGLALDASSQDMNKAEEHGLLKKFGLHRPLKDWGTKKEPWHVEIAESRSFGGGIINQKSIDYANSLIKKGNTSPNGAIASAGTVAPTKDDMTENSETAVAQQNKDVINSAKTTKRSKATPTPSVDANSTKDTSLAAKVKDKVKDSINSATAEASANVKSMYADNTTTEQTPTYTYTNMTGEGDNKHILTQNTMQSSITGANNGSAPIVAELQLISKILSEFRGDVVGFINTLLTGASSSSKTEQPRSIDLNNNKAGLLTANNVDENTIKDIGDKLLTYISGIISATTKSNITYGKHTPNMLANNYPLSSSKTR